MAGLGGCESVFESLRGHLRDRRQPLSQDMAIMDVVSGNSNDLAGTHAGLQREQQTVGGLGGQAVARMASACRNRVISSSDQRRCRERGFSRRVPAGRFYLEFLLVLSRPYFLIPLRATPLKTRSLGLPPTWICVRRRDFPCRLIEAVRKT